MRDFFGERLHDFFLSTVTSVNKQIFFVFIYFLRFFWKEQFDTFDNWFDVLRAAFYDSCDVCIMSSVAFWNVFEYEFEKVNSKYEEEHSQAVTVWTTQWNFEKFIESFLE